MRDLPLWIDLAIKNGIDLSQENSASKAEIIALLRQWGIPISSDGKRLLKEKYV